LIEWRQRQFFLKQLNGISAIYLASRKTRFGKHFSQKHVLANVLLNGFNAAKLLSQFDLTETKLFISKSMQNHYLPVRSSQDQIFSFQINAKPFSLFDLANFFVMIERRQRQFFG
jgi:hypothetical protein